MFLRYRDSFTIYQGSISRKYNFDRLGRSKGDYVIVSFISSVDYLICDVMMQLTRRANERAQRASDDPIAQLLHKLNKQLGL